MPTSVSALLTAAALESPSSLAVTETAGRSVTWAQLEDEVDRVSVGYGLHGLVAGNRVMIVVGNRLEFITTYLGALRAQLVAVPVNPRSTAVELARVLVDSGSRMVVTDPDSVTTVREAVRLVERAKAGELDYDPEALAGLGTPRLVVIGSTLLPEERGYDHLSSSHGRALPPLQDGEALAALLYTSGTSGRPRAAMLSHRALVANIEQVAAVDPPMITADDVVLGVLPLFHVYGLNAVLGGLLRQRARLVLVDGFDPGGTLDIIEDEAVSVVPVAPPVLAYWLPLEDLAERLGPVRLMLSGSAALPADVLEEFVARTGIPVHQGYGLTEASPVVTSTLCSTDPDAASVGAALPGIEVRLVDESGHTPAADDPGDIQIRGDNLFSGYWPDGRDGPDDEGWWSTGDVGLLDADGDLFLVDRRKEIVIVSGFNVYPVEVEDVIGEVPGVELVAVIGVPDDKTGEAVVAYVVPAAEADADRLAESVSQACAEQLAGFKRPSQVHVVDELPLTVTGKVQKGRLRAVERRRALGLLE
jgi:long-chain acyl-CoA synthetase